VLLLLLLLLLLLRGLLLPEPLGERLLDSRALLPSLSALLLPLRLLPEVRLPLSTTSFAMPVATLWMVSFRSRGREDIRLAQVSASVVPAWQRCTLGCHPGYVWTWLIAARNGCVFDAEHCKEVGPFHAADCAHLLGYIGIRHTFFISFYPASKQRKEEQPSR